ncbi:MAG: ribosomal protein S18-alanine N-acetyltransferase [Granulosicoccus sp.]
MSSQPLTANISFAPIYIRQVALVGTMERRNYEFPWTDGIFRDCVKAGYTCQMVLLDDDMIGYGIMQVAADEAHILNLCIDEPCQKQGFARLLLEHLVRQAERRRAHIVFLEVRPSNPRAVDLYERSGFNEIGVRKGYYDSANGREDAIVMARNLPGADNELFRH